MELVDIGIALITCNTLDAWCSDIT